MAASMSKEEYLKRYLSENAEEKKKKKRKKVRTDSAKRPKCRIVDDDIDLKSLLPANMEETVDDYVGDNDPIIAEVIDERPEDVKLLEKYRMSTTWKTLADDDDMTTDKSGRGINRSQQRHDSDSDCSPPRMKVKDRESQSKSALLKAAKNYDSSISKPGKRKSRFTDVSPNRSESEESPPRRRRHDSDADHSPPRSRRQDSDPDQSPPRRKRHDSDSDQSPPRRQGHDSDSDQSPPRRHQSPPRRRRHDSDSDQSPPRKQRVTSNQSDPRKQKLDLVSKNVLPSRKQRHDSDCDQSPPRRKRHDSDSDQSPPRRKRNISDSDQSPPRKKRNVSDSDQSPPRRKRHDSDSDQSPPRRNRNSQTSSRSKDKNINKQLTGSEKTLAGKKAGLSSAKAMRLEADELRQKEDEKFGQISDERLGRGAATVFRDKKSGRRRNLSAEREEEAEEGRRKAKQDEQFNKWGKGLKQLEQQKQILTDALHEAEKPLARYKDDDDLDQMLRDMDRAEDPMLAFIKKKKKNTGPPVKEKPQYKGPAPPPNRFGIRPGYRWDGVDRSNGFEKQIFAKMAASKATSSAAYKWSVEDM